MNLRQNIVPPLLSVLSTLALLSACQKGEDKPLSTAQEISPADITVRATADFMAPAPIVGATIVPNSVASWLGHIILLDKTGKLYRATTDSREAETVVLGRYTDIIGLARQKQAGVFLALDQGGNIKGFIEADDAGNFEPLVTSYGDLNINGFCQTEIPGSESIKALTADGQAIIIKLDIFENNSVTLSESKRELGSGCGALNEGEFDLSTEDGASHLKLGNKTVTISDGLSIAALKTPGFVLSTQANMGSVYNKGLIVAADRDSGRVVLISRDYLLTELGAQK